MDFGNEDFLFSSLNEPQGSNDSGDPDQPNLSDLLNNAVREWANILDAVRGIAGVERLKLIEEGWDEENAQMMAMAVYGSFLSQLTGGVPRV